MISYWKLDESAGTTAADSYDGNDGTVYGNTVLLARLDEGSGATTADESAYNNPGTLLGGLDSTGRIGVRSGVSGRGVQSRACSVPSSGMCRCQRR